MRGSIFTISLFIFLASMLQAENNFIPAIEKFIKSVEYYEIVENDFEWKAYQVQLENLLAVLLSNKVDAQEAAKEFHSIQLDIEKQITLNQLETTSSAFEDAGLKGTFTDFIRNVIFAKDFPALLSVKACIIQTVYERPVEFSKTLLKIQQDTLQLKYNRLIAWWEKNKTTVPVKLKYIQNGLDSIKKYLEEVQEELKIIDKKSTHFAKHPNALKEWLQELKNGVKQRSAALCHIENDMLLLFVKEQN